MNAEEVYSFCASMPYSEATFPFDQVNLVFKVGGKMFALLPLDKPEIIIVKCNPERAVELRERYAGINAAWHFNKKHWNQMELTGSVPAGLIKELIIHSYKSVVSKLPRKTRAEMNL